jgi:hypothetical protein
MFEQLKQEEKKVVKTQVSNIEAIAKSFIGKPLCYIPEETPKGIAASFEPVHVAKPIKMGIVIGLDGKPANSNSSGAFVAYYIPDIEYTPEYFVKHLIPLKEEAYKLPVKLSAVLRNTKVKHITGNYSNGKKGFCAV